MADPYIIKMPQLSDTMTEGTVVTWEKEIGDFVERGSIVATVETDKAIMDVEVFREGYLSGPLTEVDSVIPVGEAMAYLVATESEVAAEGDATDSDPTSDNDPTVEMAQPVIDAPTDSYMIKMPQLSDTMTEGVVVSWDKEIGDQVNRGDVVAQVETDKAIMDVEIFRDGILSGPLADVDSVVLNLRLVQNPKHIFRHRNRSLRVPLKRRQEFLHNLPVRHPHHDPNRGRRRRMLASLRAHMVLI